MADAALSIVIGAQVDGAISAIERVKEKFVVLNNTLNQSSAYAKTAAEIDTKQAAALEKLREQAARAREAMKDLGNSAKEASANVEKVGASSRGMLEPLNNAYNAIRKIAYVLPGIGIGGIVSLLFNGIASALSSIGGSVKQVDDATKALEEYKKIVDSVIQNNTKEAATVDILVAKIQSGTLSREQTVTAIKELQKIAPDYFGKLDAESAKVADVTKAYALYNAQIVKTIEAQIHIAELTELVKQRLTQSQATPEGAKFIDDLIAKGFTLEQIRDRITKAGGEDIRSTAELLQQNRNLTDEQLKQLLLQSKVPAGALDILAIRQKELDIIGQINNSEVVKLVKLKEEKDDTGIRHVPLESVISFLDTSRFDENIKVFQRRLDKQPLTLTFRADIQKIIDDSKELNARAEKIAKEFTGILNSALEAGIEAIARNTIGGNIKGLFVDLESIIGEGLESLGKSLLAAFPIIKLAKQAIENAIYDPELVAIAGVLAIAAGAAVKGLASKSGIHAFAEGGIVTGPTNALIGEAGPEVVFPLEKLNNFVKNRTGPGNMNISVQGVVQGNDLALVLARNSKNQFYV